MAVEYAPVNIRGHEVSERYHGEKDYDQHVRQVSSQFFHHNYFCVNEFATRR